MALEWGIRVLMLRASYTVQKPSLRWGGRKNDTRNRNHFPLSSYIFDSISSLCVMSSFRADLDRQHLESPSTRHNSHYPQGSTPSDGMRGLITRHVFLLHSWLRSSSRDCARVPALKMAADCSCSHSSPLSRGIAASLWFPALCPAPQITACVLASVLQTLGGTSALQTRRRVLCPLRGY